MNIRIVNLRNYKLEEGEILIKVDRSSALGNPFFMRSESQRNEVCDKYQEYFNSIISNYLNSASNLNSKELMFIKALALIINNAKVKDVALGCWCYPKRCHAEVIRDFCIKYVD